jgi:hypothetical protein
MCSGKNGLGGKLVTSTAPGLQVLWIGLGNSVRTDPMIIVGLTDQLRNSNGGSSRWVSSVSEMVWLVL